MHKQAKWIWYPGDFEIHHVLKLSCRREERGYIWPTIWRLDDCWHNVIFRRTCDFSQPETITATGTGVGYMEINHKKVPFGESVRVEAGELTITVACAKPGGLPAIKVDAGAFSSDAAWEVSAMTSEWLPVGTSDLFDETHDDPEEFPFAYQAMAPVSVTKHASGKLVDFGKEVFAELHLTGISGQGPIRVYYGESETEALDTEFSYIRDAVPDDVDEHRFPARAFRYVYIVDEDAEYTIQAHSQYLPLEKRGAFSCSDTLINKIWDVSEYTLHLNSREFFLDGIKRDRWVWSGDAYQSYLVNYYVYFDQDINRRTLYALRGKDPVVQHINTIVDYSSFWFIGIWDHYLHTGDLDFVRAIFPRMKGLLDFCLERCNADGLLMGYEEDWIFIDWARLDKDGPVCAEQMLFVRALEAYADCAALIGEDGTAYRKRAEALREKIETLYWDDEQGAYIDSFTSGKRYVSRQTNVFAIILGLVDEKRRDTIFDRVLRNDAVPPITTPYFKFYELDALCRAGNITEVLDVVRDYWGGMLALGATTIWEQYDPAEDFPEHYAMYGDKYGKSLCHAWGASPIYLIGRYVMGVRPTEPGYAAFEVAPNPGDLTSFSGVVPLPDGEVNVELLETGKLRVTATCAGGTLKVRGQEIPLPVNEMVEVMLSNPGVD